MPDLEAPNKITTYLSDIVKRILNLRKLFPYQTHYSSNIVKKQKDLKCSDDVKICEEVLSSKGYNKTAIDNLTQRVRKVDKYSTAALSEAIMLRSISRPCYETLRKNKLTINPLPHPKTLSNHIRHFQCAPGFQDELFHLLKYKLSTEKPDVCDCIIMFDEMQVNEIYEYNPRLKKIFPGHKKAQVVLLR